MLGKVHLNPFFSLLTLLLVRRFYNLELSLLKSAHCKKKKPIQSLCIWGRPPYQLLPTLILKQTQNSSLMLLSNNVRLLLLLVIRLTSHRKVFLSRDFCTNSIFLSFLLSSSGEEVTHNDNSWLFLASHLKLIFPLTNRVLDSVHLPLEVCTMHI